MRTQSITRLAALGALVAGLACGKNLDTMAKPDETAVKPDTTQEPPGYKAGTRDTTLNGPADSAKARPDQGQPVTAKGDTLNMPSGFVVPVPRCRCRRTRRPCRCRRTVMMR